MDRFCPVCREVVGLYYGLVESHYVDLNGKLIKCSGSGEESLILDDNGYIVDSDYEERARVKRVRDIKERSC